MPRKPKATMNAVTPIVAASTAPKTTEEKLVAAIALVAKLEQQLVSENLKNDVQIEDEIEFIFGRGDKKVTKAGSVMATQDVPEGTLKGLNLRVLVGTGFDAETFKVHIRDVISNVTADARRAAEAGEAGSTDEAVDPLTAE